MVGQIISGTGYDCFLSLPQREKEGKWGKRLFFITFSISSIPKLVKK